MAEAMKRVFCNSFKLLTLKQSSIVSSTKLPATYLVSKNGINLKSYRYGSNESKKYQGGLNEFFDNEGNWNETTIPVGRPWKVEELRLKSNEDLHKLWYVLLKERNMIMTMEAEYERNFELFPSPERMDKLEESMENLLDVVNERDRAYNLLEHGVTGEAGSRYVFNQLGIGTWRRCTEHYIPLHYNKSFQNKFNGPWQNKYLRLLRETRLRLSHRKILAKERKINNLTTAFPHLKGKLDNDDF